MTKDFVSNINFGVILQLDLTSEMNTNSPGVTNTNSQRNKNMMATENTMQSTSLLLSKQRATNNEPKANDDVFVDFVSEAKATILPVPTTIATVLTSSRPSHCQRVRINLLP